MKSMRSIGGIIACSGIAVCLIGLKAITAFADSPQIFDIEELKKGNIPPYTIRAGHPRLFITPDNKNAIVQRIINSAFGRQAFQKLIDTADAGMNTDFTAIPQTESGRSAFPRFQPYVEAYGILHQLGALLGLPPEEPNGSYHLNGFIFKHGLGAYEAKGVGAYLALVRHRNASFGSNYTRDTALATGYDWFYDLFSQEERKEAIAKLVESAIVWPLQNDPNYPSATQQVASLKYMHGVAFYGDNIDMPIAFKVDGKEVTYSNSNGASQRIINEILTRSLWGPTGILSRFEVLMGGVNDEEIVYASYYYKVFPILEAWYTATGQDFWQAGVHWKRFMQWLIYNTLPHQETGKGPWYYPHMPQAYLGASLQDNDTMKMIAASTSWLGRMEEKDLADVAAWAMRLPTSWGAYDVEDFLYGVLMGDPLRTPRSPKEAAIEPSLVLPGPIARTYMRSGWDSYDATFAMHSVAEWPLRSTESCMNSIFLWKNGGTLLTHKQGYVHDYGPSSRWNIVLPYAPGDYSDGGMTGRWSWSGADNRWRDVTLFTHKSGFLRGAEVIAGKYGYSAGDTAEWLKWHSNNSIQSSDRQVVWFPAPAGTGSDYFLIFDRVSTDGKTVEPHVIFNTPVEPVLSRNFGAPIEKSTMTSRVTGHWLTTDADAMTVTNDQPYAGGHPPAHAKMFAKVLLPSRPKIHLLGGVGGSYRVRVKIVQGGNDSASTYAIVTDGKVARLFIHYAGIGSGYAKGQEAKIQEVETGIQTATVLITDVNESVHNSLVSASILDPGSGYAAGQDKVDVTYATGINDIPVYFSIDDLDGREATDDRFKGPYDPRALWGLWGFHLVNQDLQADNLYLVALEATDSAQLHPSGDMALLQGQGLVGAKVADTVTIFNSTYSRIAGGSITVPASPGSHRMLISDLSPNSEYKLSILGTDVTKTSTSAGIIYLEGVSIINGGEIVVTQSGQTPPILRGDVDQNGSITLADAIKLVRMLAGLEPLPDSGTLAFARADCNADGLLSIADVTCIINKLLGR